MASLCDDKEGSCSYPVWGNGWRLKIKLFHAPKGPLWPLHFLFLARGRVGLGGRHPLLGVTERSGKALDWITVCAYCNAQSRLWPQTLVPPSSPDTCLTQEKQEDTKMSLGVTRSGSLKGGVRRGGERIRSNSRYLS